MSTEELENIVVTLFDTGRFTTIQLAVRIEELTHTEIKEALRRRGRL